METIATDIGQIRRRDVGYFGSFCSYQRVVCISMVDDLQTLRQMLCCNFEDFVPRGIAMARSAVDCCAQEEFFL
jgi:hypothetical protein